MSTFVNKFNETTAKFCRTVRLDQLDGDAYYPVKSMRTVHTKYGDTLVATLTDRSMAATTGSEDIDVFLPKRYAQVFDPNEPIPDGLELSRGEKIGTTFNIQLRVASNARL